MDAAALATRGQCGFAGQGAGHGDVPRLGGGQARLGVVQLALGDAEADAEAGAEADAEAGEQQHQHQHGDEGAAGHAQDGAAPFRRRRAGARGAGRRVVRRRGARVVGLLLLVLVRVLRREQGPVLALVVAGPDGHLLGPRAVEVAGLGLRVVLHGGRGGSAGRQGKDDAEAGRQRQRAQTQQTQEERWPAETGPRAVRGAPLFYRIAVARAGQTNAVAVQ